MKSGVSLVLSSLEELLRNKLETSVLEAMNDPNHVSIDFLEQREIAAKNGFNDLLVGFDEVLREVGHIQVVRTLERKKHRSQIRLEELALQEYLVKENGANLHLVDENLEYISHEVPRKGGRLDILTKDEEGEVKLELKARDYDWKNVHAQIMAYHNEKPEDSNAKTYFVANDINPQLFYSLLDRIKTGEIRFFQASKSNGEFEFKEMTEADIPEPKRIDWTRKKNGSKDEDKVRVTAAVSRVGKWPNKSLELRAKVLGSTEEIINFDEKDLEDWRAQPYLRRAALLSSNSELFPELEPGFRQMVPERDYRRLQNLAEKSIEPNDNEIASIEDYSASYTLKTKMPKQKLKNISDTIMLAMTLGRDAMNEFRKESSQLFNGLKLEGRLEDKIEKISKIAQGLRKKISEINTRFPILEELEKVVAESYSMDPSDRDMIKKVKNSIGFSGYQLQIELYEQKTERARALACVNRNLAEIYLCHSPGGAQILENPNANVDLSDTRDIIFWAKKDNQLYSELFSLCHPVEIQEPVSTSVREPTEPAPRPSPAEQKTHLYTLREISGGQKPKHRKELTIIAKGFVNEVLNNKDLSSGLRSDLKAAIERSHWYSRGLDDEKVEFFFRNLRSYANEGRVPTGEEMDQIMNPTREELNQKRIDIYLRDN